ncbi:4-(cytidine 5'-diphospho)-2-C-methyl-D-erythritol kinase [Mesorhizobium sp. NBSH29]|uniref:4-(cytidine 5'-diphospho)-2-C-methyl-D-erythritol kinase n=1 Tax=Mesorhizobium sp. NBSH29 TaxID=2654249 RepID=UPI0018965FF2|nr:4-(cytidine 5'-diphospho)-2-C-methyl-D-erythritol kinase [Mesorhizobium sp. NBSH29]QPC88639.1 4-(cytidine 5'-diphospho)-2-C-methyl-D-erythritol kinase [Mesorhizobium sp. NBSH29]
MEHIGATWRAPAKINLALHVTGRRPDGYHMIESLAVFTRFGDLITVRSANEDSFSVSGPFADKVPVDANLILSARDALRSAFPAQCCSPVEIVLEKNLPVASGLGGGSSDAAVVLRELTKLWSIPCTHSDLAQLGGQLGADVPMCLSGKPLLASGIGETVLLVSDFPALGLVLVNPGIPVATSNVFAALLDHNNEALPPLPSQLNFHTIRNWLEITRNDLEIPARIMQPVIGSVVKSLDRAGSAFTRMSGSGATCFGLFESGNMAKRAAISIRARNPGWFVAATRSLASEDVLRAA